MWLDSGAKGWDEGVAEREKSGHLRGWGLRPEPQSGHQWRWASCGQVGLGHLVCTHRKSFCQTACVGWEYCVGGIQAEMVSRWHLKSELGGDR